MGGTSLSPAWSLLLSRAHEKPGGCFQSGMGEELSSLLHVLKCPRTHPCHQPETLVVLSTVPCTPSPYTERPEAG